MAGMVINLSERRLYFNKDGTRFFQSYPVAIGKPSTPTPTGTWEIIWKTTNPGGILGSRWMQLNIPAEDGVYGIHGTTQPWSIGKAVSHGCVRMYNKDVEEIFPLTSVGTTVEIVRRKTDTPAAPQETPVAKPGVEESAKNLYVVRKGDTLWQIAVKNGVSLEALIAVNNIKDPDRLTPGQILAIPE